MSKRSPFLRRARLEHHRLARERARVQAAHLLGQLGRAHGEVAASERLGARPAAHLLVRGIDVHHPEALVAQHHRVGGGVEDRAVAALARAQRLFGALARGDVASDVERVRPAAVRHRHHRHLEEEARAVLAHRLDPSVPPRPARARCIATRSGFFRDAHRQPVHAEHLGAGVAAQRLVRGVHVDDAEVRVAQHERVGRGVEDRAVLLLARAQRLVCFPRAPCSSSAAARMAKILRIASHSATSLSGRRSMAPIRPSGAPAASFSGKAA